MPAKTSRPSSDGAIRRDRLFRSIEKGRTKRILWIEGPAGSGKTTLVSSYFSWRKTPCLWYQMDEGDKDLATFFYYLGLAAKKATPRNRTPLPMLSSEYLQGIPVFARRFFEQLGEQLTRKSGNGISKRSTNYSIVFDDYHEIPADSIFHEILNAGISSLPEEINVVILSRDAPHAAFARLRARSEMGHLSWEDIKLTGDESNTIAALKAGRSLNDETLSLLHRITDGWVAGLVLLIEGMGIDRLQFEVSSDLSKETVYSYFATELFGRRSREDKDFLIATSFLPRMSIPMAEDLTGNPNASSILSNLSRSNFFTTTYVSPEPTFQYHPLFKEFLQAKASETLPPEDLAEVRRRAAKVLDAYGYEEDAVNMFCKAHEWADTVRMILALAPNLIAQGRWRTLLGWIESLPASLKANESWLLYWSGLCSLRVSPAESRNYFQHAFGAFKDSGDVSGSFLALSGLLDSITFGFDTFHELDQLLDMMETLLEEYPQFPSPLVESRVIASMIDAIVLRRPENTAWEHWEGRALELIKKTPDRDLALHILCGIAYYRLFAGDIEKALLIIDSIDMSIDAVEATPFAVIVERCIQAFYYWISADFKKNRCAAEAGIALADSRGIHTLDCMLLGHATAGALSAGEIARADGYLERMLADLRMSPGAYRENMYHNLKAWRCLLEEDLAQASMQADLAIESGVAMGSPLTEPYQYLIKAIVMHRLGNNKEAIRQLSRFGEICSKVPHLLDECMAIMLEAQIAFDGGDEKLGTELLRKALAYGREHGYANSFGWHSSMVAGLCVKALEAGIETDYVQALVRKRKLIPKETVSHLENWPWPFRIYTLGRFELVRNSDTIRFSGKVQQKPILLLKALIAFGGRQVNQELLCDALWPDADADLAHRSFETTLYRLRKLLGKDTAVHLQDGRLTLDARTCWVDAFALEHILEETETLYEASKRSESDHQHSLKCESLALRCTQTAISLYKGHFINSESELLWMRSPRERLRSKYMRGMESLSRYWGAAGQLEMAIKCCEKALEVDDLAEEFYQYLIEYNKQLGRSGTALAIYKRCQSTMKAKLGIEPSPKTKSFSKGIVPVP